MVERKSAEGSDCSTFLVGLGRPLDKFPHAVFYLDGDDIRGELDLVQLQATLNSIGGNLEADRQTIWVTDGMDSGREAHAISVPLGYESLLPRIMDSEVEKKPVVGKHKLVEGTTYIVDSHLIINRRFAMRILVLAESPDEAKKVAARKFSGSTNGTELWRIVTNPKLVPPDDFWLEAKRQIDSGIRLSEHILIPCGLVEYQKRAEEKLLRRQLARR